LSAGFVGGFGVVYLAAPPAGRTWLTLLITSANPRREASRRHVCQVTI
jgi:hypothetical protein